MVKVTLSGTLKAHADGQEVFEVEAKTIRELLDRLGQQRPKLQPYLAKGIAVAVDGTIYRDAWFQPIKPDSEVFLLPRLAGG